MQRQNLLLACSAALLCWLAGFPSLTFIEPAALVSRAAPLPLARAGEFGSPNTGLGSTHVPAALSIAVASLVACSAAARRAKGSTSSCQPRPSIFASGALERPARVPAIVGRRFFGEDDDPYSRCTSLKLQLGFQYSKQLLESLNKLAETADTSSEEGLHQLLLDIVVNMRRGEPSWRYGFCERLVFDVDDDGARQSTSALQRWGIEAQTKFGDGEDWAKMEKNQPKGVTEFLILTVLVSCYGPICPEIEDLQVRSTKDLRAVLDGLSGVQEDELIQLDVQWIPEEDGDTLSTTEMTVKFPEMMPL
mmetsp:Transcript_62132/g.115272  ORF Transcript_62132/g.115272 Transcript_62132/m.115272 type:complete len:306 (+) Transcript_62132:74-991(+)